MKLSKIFLLAGAVLAFASCSEKEEWNTSNEAVVSMAKAEMTVSEASGMFNIPFVVTGERNAPVQVFFEVVDYTNWVFLGIFIITTNQWFGSRLCTFKVLCFIVV